MLAKIDELILNEIKSLKLQNNPTALVEALVNSPMICALPILEAEEIFPLNTKLENSIFFPSDLVSREERQEIIESYEAIASELERSYFLEEIEYNNKLFKVYYETNIIESENSPNWAILSIRYTNTNMDEILLGLIITKYSLSSSTVALRIKYSPSNGKEIHKGIEDLLLDILSKK